MHQQPQIPKQWFEKQKGRRQGSVLGVFAGGSVLGVVNFLINKKRGVKAPFWERSPEAPFWERSPEALFWECSIFF